MAAWAWRGAEWVAPAGLFVAALTVGHLAWISRGEPLARGWVMSGLLAPWVLHCFLEVPVWWQCAACLVSSLLSLAAYDGVSFRGWSQLPELTGIRRRFVDSVALNQGVSLESIKVTDLGPYGAMLAGLHKHMLILDKNTAEGLTDSRLTALLAHEFAHAKNFTNLTRTCLGTTLLCAGALVHSCISPSWGVATAAALFVVVRSAHDHISELVSDRHTAATVGEREASDLLSSMRARQPQHIRWLASSVSLTALTSHPPFSIREFFVNGSG